MSSRVVIEQPPRPPIHRSIPARAAVFLALLLGRRSPQTIEKTLTYLRRGARAATYEQARSAHNDVTATSVLCAGEGCLPRSLAIVLLCRFRNTWPTWHIGIRTGPFESHAWVEAEGQMVNEPHSDDYYRPIMTVAHPV
ncbi:lasso peptide biosynthesis B2 protein [Streptomyces sp. NBC_01167]|uniref:lasso peptide biosynthesis B2 protein n=1 Tax=Streptomyces sp. NBC_01167 TaxID=2903756 RepID=UPI00386AA490|nr:lasso peptide biosynthesis B2 protein [Streptomyces sp. NBC_01167]